MLPQSLRRQKILSHDFGSLAIYWVIHCFKSKYFLKITRKLELNKLDQGFSLRRTPQTCWNEYYLSKPFSKLFKTLNDF